MKRLIIFLKFVERRNNKIYNTLSYVIKNDEDKYHLLDVHRGNVNKYQISFFK